MYFYDINWLVTFKQCSALNANPIEVNHHARITKMDKKVVTCAYITIHMYMKINVNINSNINMNIHICVYIRIYVCMYRNKSNMM